MDLMELLKNFTEIEWKGNNILLFGSESYGMHQHTYKYADFIVKIDINKNIESLNISNSANRISSFKLFEKKELINFKILNNYYVCPCSSAGRAIDL